MMKMTDTFLKAYSIVMKIEGGYSNDSTDRGGETYKGIARKKNPSWPGWKLVDALKTHLTDAELEEALNADSDLQKSVKEFYFNLYYVPIKLELIEKYSASVAIELFEQAVNMGIFASAKNLQESLNLLNRCQKNWENIVVDGLIGKKTLSIFDKFEKKDFDNLLKLLNCLQGCFYIGLATKDETQEKYIRGWLDRT